MGYQTKIALLIVDTASGTREIVKHDDCAASVREHALAAQSAGHVTMGGKVVPIVGGFVVCSWREPCVTFRFRCNPASKPKK
jgi:hypothetical protein